MAERELLVRIVGDDRDLQRALGNSQRSLQRIDSRMQSFGKNVRTAFAGAGIALGASAIFAALNRSVSAASDLNEQISKSRQVFGDSSQAIESWSQTTAKALGITQREALTATGTFGNLFNTVGLGQQVGAEMSQTLVQLAADLASFNNANPEDVLTALRSGLIGEAEPLRRFGVLLSEARVQQAALDATGKTNVKTLTDQEKAVARYNIILSDTVSAQGDFSRTSEGLANQSRILNAQLGDLSAEIGGKLVPHLITAARAANGLIDAFNALSQGTSFELFGQIEDIDLTALKETRNEIAGLKGDTDLLVQALDDAIAKLQTIQPLRPDDRAGPRGPGAISASNERVEAEKAQAALDKAKRELERSRKQFAESIKGLGLKLDRAGLTESEQDDLAVLREIERRIQRQIAIEGHTFELEQALVRNRQDQQDILERMSADAEEKQTASRKRRADKAKSERDKRKRISEQERKDRQADLFEDLGLTREGDPRTPGSGALLRRAQNLQDRVQGTPLDTGKTRQQLSRIVSVLKKNFKTAGKDVRQAILEMLNDISDALEGKGAKKSGPLTKTSSLNSKKLLEGIGLSPDEIRELRVRLSNFNSAGVGFAGATGTSGTRTSSTFTAREPIVVESRTNLYLDGQQIATAVTKQQQKAKRRNPRQKRGPNRR